MSIEELDPLTTGDHDTRREKSNESIRMAQEAAAHGWEACRALDLDQPLRIRVRAAKTAIIAFLSAIQDDYFIEVDRHTMTQAALELVNAKIKAEQAVEKENRAKRIETNRDMRSALRKTKR